MTAQAPADWYPDPFGRHELRYWDGRQWTQHVAAGGRQAIDPPFGGSPVPTVNRASKKAQRQERGIDVSDGAQAGGEALFTERVLVVIQKAKLFEVNAEYAVYDKDGRQLGEVREVGQSFMKKAVGVRPYQDRTHRLQVVDMNGRVLLSLTRPAKLYRSKMMAPRSVRSGKRASASSASISTSPSSPGVSRWARLPPRAEKRLTVTSKTRPETR